MAQPHNEPKDHRKTGDEAGIRKLEQLLADR
jgi:hypothetical protein